MIKICTLRITATNSFSFFLGFVEVAFQQFSYIDSKLEGNHYISLKLVNAAESVGFLVDVEETVHFTFVCGILLMINSATFLRMVLEKRNFLLTIHTLC